MWLRTPLSAYYSMIDLSQFQRLNVVESEEFPGWWDLRAYEFLDDDDDESVFVHRGTEAAMRKLMLTIGAGEFISSSYAPTTITFH